MSGAIYYNTLTFYSDTLPIPEILPEIEAELVSQINERYMDSAGKLPAPKTDVRKKFDKDLKEATDGVLRKSEMSIFLIRSWLADDAVLLKKALGEANSFFASHILGDFKRTQIPQLVDEDVVLETLESGRKVIVKGDGVLSGAIESKPATVDEFASWGNSTKFAKENLEKAKEISRASKKSKRSKKTKKTRRAKKTTDSEKITD